MGREERINQEAVELWCELYGELPPPHTRGVALLEAILRRMGHSDYSRLTSPHLRPANIAMPGRPQA